MATSPLSRIAGPLAVIAGVLVVATRIPTILFILGGGDLTSFVLGPTHAITSVASILAFGLLVLALVAIYEREAQSAGWFGLIGFAAALLGTIAMAGDWWYEAFAVPRIAEVAPELIATFVGGRLLMGGLASFVLLGIGWVLFGAASLRARVFPTAISAAILIGGLLSGIPIGLAYLTGGVILGLAIAWLGAWLMRAAPASEVVASGTILTV
ncbi:MAG TPA: hypothetical protein VFP66_14800 [Candidatus Limnocylindrales bacterium]|nr:hypothetical protein [Candidatus Limnocylindrales bacterium]